MSLYSAFRHSLKDANIVVSTDIAELKGASNKDFTTLEADIEAILANVNIPLSNFRDVLDSRLYNSADALSVYDHLKQMRTQIDSYLINLDIKLSELKAVGTETPRTLSNVYDQLTGIKTQTDKLTFDANNFLKVATQADKVTQQPLSAVSIAAASTQNADIVVPTGRSGIAVTLKATYDVSATAGVRLDALYSPDGTNYDTDTDDTYAHPFTAGTIKQKTYIIPAIHPYVRLVIENLDASYAVTTDLWVTFV